jgi:hypothetical protein
MNAFIHNAWKGKLISDVFVLLENVISQSRKPMQRLNLCLRLGLQTLVNMGPISEHKQISHVQVGQVF